MRLRDKWKKALSVALSTVMVISLGNGIGVPKQAKAEEASQTETLYYNFSELKDVSQMEISKDYALFSQEFEDSQAVISLPEDGAIVKFGGTKEDVDVAGGLFKTDNGVEYPYSFSGASQLGGMKVQYIDGMVKVVRRGTDFDTCIYGGIGYRTFTEADKIKFSSNSGYGDAIGTGWWYGCTGGGVYYCGPYHVYTYDEYQFTADDIKIEQSDSWKEPTGATVVKKDDIVVKIHVQDGTMDEWVSVPFYDIDPSDNTVDPTTQDNKITVTLGKITKQVAITKAHEHAFSDEWTSDDTDHWHACTAANCDGTVADKAEHTASDWIIDKEATQTETGSKHKECTVCKRVLETQEIEKLPHVHDFSEEWSSDDTDHWHACTAANCDGTVADKAEHTASDWIVDKEATQTETGSKHKECTVCKKVLDTVIIPKNSSSDGKVTVVDTKIGEGAPKADLASDADQVKNSVELTKEEEEQVSKGEIVDIYLQIQTKETTATQEEKDIIERAKADYTIGTYIDASLFKKVGSNDPVAITELKDKIKVQLVVPEKLRNTDANVVRTYSLIRRHGSEDTAEIVNGTYDSDTFTFTFETDRFSTYAIAYKDTTVNNGNQNNNTNAGNNTNTGNNTVTDNTKKDTTVEDAKINTAQKNVESMIEKTIKDADSENVTMTEKEFKEKIAQILQNAGVTGNVVSYKVVQATEQKAGSVTAQITITSGDVTKTITITKTIPKKLNGNDIASLKLPLLMTKGIGGKNKISLSWTKDTKATGYEVYWSYCNGKQNFKLLKETEAKNRKVTHTKLKNAKAYKYFVVSYKIVDGQKVYLRKSAQIHVAMNKQKKTNAKKITVKKAAYTLNVKKTAKIKAATVRENKNKKVLTHAKEFRYFTSDAKIATVSNKGVITAKKKGNCKVYVMANNGVYKTIKVQVK